MTNAVSEIKNYILFLKKKCHLQVTQHPQGEECLISGSELTIFNIHENPHCVYVKTFQKAHDHCVNRQCKITEKCKDGPFSGTCYAGVFEYVYPVFDSLSVTCFICVSGYKSPNYGEYIKKCSAKFNIPADELFDTAMHLKSKIPEKSYVDTLIFPLVRMLELAYISIPKEYENSSKITSVKNYINRNYSQSLNVEQISKQFSCSPSHISHMFKKTTGKSFREYLTEIRLNVAKSLLLNSHLTVTEIAYSVGFNDSNYFSNVFKSHIGTSPREYKKRASL